MPTSPFTVIYSFGDSLSDAGDAYLLTSSSVGKSLGLQPQPVSPPYAAITYAAPGGGTVTADEFTNGEVWVQHLATSLGLAQPGPGEVGETTAFGYIPVIAGAANGTDFAIGGSVTGPSGENTGAAVGVTDLAAQVTNFKNEVPAPASSALYTVWSGSNDLLNLLNDPNFASDSQATIATDINQSVSNEISAIQSLINDGARTILVPNIPDLGLIPEVTALGAGVEAVASNLAQSFNTELVTAIGSLTGSASVKVLDVYSLIDNAVNDPGKYGLTDATDSVYTGGFTADSPPPTVTGAAQNQYLFFDKLHPTDAGQQAVANLALSALGLACYVRGTRIAVPGGERAVEALVPGELVLTGGGVARPVRWIGRRSYAGRFLAANTRAHPVRFRAGSLGGGLPRRDLLVSADHAMLLDGVLVPARCLLNGTSIVQDRTLAEVEYFHIELDSHDVLLAEGAASESYLDEGNRAMFQTGSGRPLGDGDAGYCAPRLAGGYAVEALRARLAGLAAAEPCAA